ncbi:alpha/beta fold hydrolase [Pseudonocardia abyssalis]|uniref:Alpha/beta hydrolase n=1 Tax=Pseudonocardia abyssalis TaxID=2792008 RepID=A0ABS6UR56_9PSEU|nr:alpha/beta hydrolase [Pseudonocardia abyssalis]MBW0117297.1 alpha/beta hydrolase [Pseudonocardia abyssalis]MBW0134234.1 alpha/beta hydrolase [Pseudonocardia abyssalis]
MPITETRVATAGAELCVQTFGSPEDPAVLLIAGAASSMDWWEDAFCARLAEGGRYVVRYDHRDTGTSTSWPAGEPGYTGADLTADALGVLDGLGVAAAHVVGISMGGGIGQELALEHAGRVATLTLLSTSPIGSVRATLPPMREDVARSFAEPQPDPDWSDAEAAVTAFVDGERLFHGTLPFDEGHVRELAARVVARSTDIAATMTNHWILDQGDPRTTGIGAITVPTLVLHGTEDPLFPIGHGEAIAAEIPGARLVPLPGVGHQMPPTSVWDVVITEILAHTSR